MSGKRSPSHPIPDTKTAVSNLRDYVFLPLEGYTVSQWHPLPDGKGRPEAIVLQLATTVEWLAKTTYALINKNPNPKMRVDMVLRIKSREEANRLINILTTHADEVWPVQ